MILQKQFFNFVLTTIVTTSAALLFTACGGKKQSQAVDFEDTDTYSNGAGSTGTTSSLPSYLFETNTNYDPIPQTGTTVNYGSVSQTENTCLSSDSSLFNPWGTNLPAQTGCYSSNNYITQDMLYQASLAMNGSIDQCLNYALMLEPTSMDATEAAQRTALAESVILRCARQNIRDQWRFTNWSNQQSQVYASTDNVLYLWLQQVQQAF